MADSSGNSSVDFTHAKRIETQYKEDRISDLPDSISQHIISLLPFTQDAVRTGILSKRWRNWTHVPVLIFKPSPTSGDNYFRFIGNTLIFHDCPKIKKFDLEYDRGCDLDSQFTSKIQFAIRKCVQELVLIPQNRLSYLLPEFLFNSSSMVRLEMFNCYFMPSWRVNWPSLKSLKMDFRSLSRAENENCSRGIENVVSGSPLLEWLELRGIMSNDVAIVSKSLKVLSFVGVGLPDATNISCPNLLEFNAVLVHCHGQIIENALSGSPLIHSLKIYRCSWFGNLVIASKSLKVLHLAHHRTDTIEVSCPNLEILDFYCEFENNLKSVNLPSSVCATLDFYAPRDWELDIPMKGLLEQFQHVNKLTIKESFLKILSRLNAEVCLSLPLLNSKCLTLNVDGFFGSALPGIAYALRSPMLETLIIDLRSMSHQDISENDAQDWNSNGSTGFTCLESHLKTVKIFGLYEADDKCECVLEFIEFLLKNARVLEKMIVLLKKSISCFVIEVSQKLLSFPRYSRCANVELLCST